jgi:hypothetical protein
VSENYKIQISYKIGPTQQHMLNVRADTAEEFTALLSYAEITAPAIVEVANTLNAAVSLASPPTVAPAPAAQPQTQTPPQWAGQPQAQPAQGAKMCVHGPRVHKTGVAKGTGKPWAGWFCALPKASGGCGPEWDDN